MISKVRGAKLYGAMVIAMAEAMKLGRVSEVYIDKETKKIMGISYRPSMLNAEREVYVEAGEILKFGGDILIISSQASGRERPAEMGSYALRKLRGTRITSQAGEHIASLADVVIDGADGKIVEILLPESLKLEIDMDRVVFGRDLIMVPADYKPATEWVEPESGDFIHRFFGSTPFSEKLRGGMEDAKSTVRQNINRDKVMQSLRSGSILARDAISRTSQAIQEALNQRARRQEEPRNRTGSEGSQPTSEAGYQETEAPTETAHAPENESAREEHPDEKP